ncbi:MAG: PKD domain-containing protein, partial [Lentimicrobium sp.]|nr:PKD domain-containing protein [Lentimicrobium sp.]
CTWTEVRFEGSATIAEPYTIASYIWEFGDSTYTENPVAAHIYESPGSYEATFKAFSNAGCFTEQKHQVYIDPSYQLLQLSVNVENEVCFGDGTASATLNASGGTQPYQYLLNNETASAQLNNLTSGEYLFTVLDQQQCIVSKDTTIYPLVYLNPQITALPDSGFSPLEVQFSFTANNPDSWVWEFGDGTSDTTLQPIHSYTSYGYQYPVLTLNSGEPHFCVETDTVSIFVDVKVEMEANNVFTPNGDGYNDFFEVRTEGIGELEVSLFDRQNKLIYEINEVGGKWDGNNSSGNEAPEAEYYYYLKATAFNGDSHEKQGVVMLLRDDSKVFPNPVKSGLFLKAEGFTDQSIDVNIFSIEGTKMLSKIVPNDDIIRFDIDYLPGGLYIIQLKDSKMIKSIRFIKY